MAKSKEEIEADKKAKEDQAKADAEAKNNEETQDALENIAEAEEKKLEPGVYVAKGKSVSTAVGIIGAGKKVPEKAISPERVKELVKSKALIVVK